MIYSETFKQDVSNAKAAIEKFIESVERQKAQDPLLYSFRDGFAALDNFIANDQAVNESFIKKWDRIYGVAFRSFEGHPFLDTLDTIHDEIHSIYERNKNV